MNVADKCIHYANLLWYDTECPFCHLMNRRCMKEDGYECGEYEEEE